MGRATVARYRNYFGVVPMVPPSQRTGDQKSDFAFL